MMTEYRMVTGMGITTNASNSMLSKWFVNLHHKNVGNGTDGRLMHFSIHNFTDKMMSVFFDSLHKIEALLHDGETDDDGESHGDDGETHDDDGESHDDDGESHGDDGESHDDDGESHGVETTHALSLPSKPSKPSKPLIPLIPLIPLTPCHR